MNWREFINSSVHALQTRLFDIGDTPVSVATLITAIFIIIGTFICSRIIQKLIIRLMNFRGARSDASASVIARLVHYFVIVGGFGVALQTIGVDLGALFAAGAIFAVGLGFAMQNIAQNFVAGVILMAERTIKPGDILWVEEKMVKIVELGIRATIAQTRDGEDVIIPNSVLIQSSVKNFTLKNSRFRIRVPVGVSYRSDMTLVRKTLEQVATKMQQKWKCDSPWQVIMTSFGSSSVDYEIAVWISEPWDYRIMLSELHEAIWRAFSEENIIISYPQLDVHFDSEILPRRENVELSN